MSADAAVKHIAANRFTFFQATGAFSVKLVRTPNTLLRGVMAGNIKIETANNRMVVRQEA